MSIMQFLEIFEFMFYRGTDGRVYASVPLYFSRYSGGLRCEYTPLATYTRADTKENRILAPAC